MSGRKLRVTIEGEIGTGKTTLAAVLARALRAAGIHTVTEIDAAHVKESVRLNSEELRKDFWESINIVCKIPKCVSCGKPVPLDADFCEECEIIGGFKDGS